MTRTSEGRAGGDAAAEARPRTLLLAYGAAIFLSAALLFAVQPLFAKMVLPSLGGAPSVWSVAMVFFQGMLLAGYLYAHLLTSNLPGRRSVMVHVIVLLAATLALPLGIATGWGRPPTENEAIWLIGLFAASIGLPFFALAANAPLLQAWFARTGHPSANDPYFLYAASNVGSFLALLSYPLAVEPLTQLSDQTWVWSALFYVLIALIVACGLLLVRSRDTEASAEPVSEAGHASAPTWRDVATWMGLAAVPSGLMIAVTAHISTDVAAAPLLWVIPLALYLLTFVIVFQTRPILPHSWFVRIQPIFLALLILTFAIDLHTNILALVAIHVATFFVTAMVCHGELARRRPPARYLTVFYLWMSAGGVTGGIFAGLLAPHMFDWVAEYPLLIVAAVLCRPGFVLPNDPQAQRFWVAALIVVAVVAIPRFVFGYEFDYNAYGGIVLVLLGVALVLSHDTLKFGAAIALALMFVRVYDPEATGRESVRSFFGVHKILDTGDYRVLLHGTTIHGAQRIRDNGEPITDRPEPITYYTLNSGIGQAIGAAREKMGGSIRIAAIGLGTGSVACLTEEGDTLTFYEIDRTVVQIARDEQIFTFVSGCAPDASIVMGDARLTLADAEDGSYDIIIVDAFSSDAIPTHLLTREAMEIYLRKTAPAGLVVAHVSNRHLELASVVAGIADAHGAIAVNHTGEEDDDFGSGTYRYSSNVVVVAPSRDDLGPIAERESWIDQEPDREQWVWTDDYSNIIGALMRNY